MRFLGWLLKRALILVVLAAAVWFAKNNSEPVSVWYYGAVTQVPLVVVMLIALAAGSLLGFLAGLGFVGRRRRRPVPAAEDSTAVPAAEMPAVRDA